MKKAILLFLLFISVLSNAQNAQDIIDGLKKDLKTNPDDKKRATIYSDLTWYYSNISIDSSLYYGSKAIKESVKLGDSILIAQVFSDLGAVYFKKSDFEKSKENYLKAYSIRKAKNDHKGMAKIDSNLGNIYQSQGKFQLAMSTYLRASDYFSEIGDLNQVTVIKGGIGSLYYELKDYKKALKYIDEVIKYFEDKKMKNSLCRNYLTKGNILLSLNDTLGSIKAYNKSLLICNEEGDKFTVSKSYNNLAVIKQAQNKTEESKKLFTKVSEVRKIYNSDAASNKSKLNEAYTLLKENKFEDAKKILLEINKFFIEKKLDFELSNSYKYLVPIYARLNMPDSVIHYQALYEQTIEKATRLSVVKSTAELETKYQTEKKEKQILKQQAEAKQKNIWLLLISSLAIIGLLLFRQQQLKSKQQKEQAQLENELLKEQSNFKIQEQRLGISRELHDSVGSQLTFIISILDNLKNAPVKLENTLEKKIDNLSGYANNSISELRDTIWALNSDNLTIAELETRILNFIKDASESIENVNFDFKNNVQNNHQLTSRQGINLFRVLQETVNNAIKHANANKITVVLDENNNQVSMKIQDNGKGFDYEEKKKKSYGLSNIKNRIEELDGIFQVESNEKGTLIEISIPL